MDFLFDSHAEVAVFLDRRFPTATDRANLARAAGMADASGTWKQLLAEANTRQRLPKLLRVAAELRAGDENLASMADLCARQHRHALATRLLAWTPPLVVAAGLAAAVIAVPVASDPAPAQTAAHAPDLAASLPPERSVPPSTDEAAESSASAVPSAVMENASTDAAADPSPAPLVALPTAPAPEPVPPAEPVLVASLEPAHAHGAGATTGDRIQPQGRCRSADRIVGYWYSGRSAPGASGDVITMDHSVRVRVDYPDTHNQFNSRAPVACHLAPGDRVRLSEAPIHVPGDAYWTPLLDGDLLPSEGAVADTDTGTSE